MYQGKGEKRARVSEVAEEKLEEVEYDGAEPAGVTAVEGAHSFLHGREMPPRKKSIPKKPTPKPYHLDLEVARHFGLYDEVAAMVTLTVWRYLLMEFEEDTYVDLLLEFSADELSDLMGFKDVQQIHEEELGNRCAQVANAQALWEELTRSKTLFKSSKVKSTLFIKKEHKFMHYVLSHSICGRYDSTSSVSPADLLCLYGMITIRRPKVTSIQPLIVEDVQRMYQGKGEKRARVSEVAEEKLEEVEYDGAEPAGVTAVEGSSRGTFQ
nr:hypothetical protein Iba_chr02dCG2420 [Ipomoea batatas]